MKTQKSPSKLLSITPGELVHIKQPISSDCPKMKSSAKIVYIEICVKPVGTQNEPNGLAST